MRRTTLRVLGAVMALGLLATACGDDDDDSGTAATTAGASATTASGGETTTGAGGSATTAAGGSATTGAATGGTTAATAAPVKGGTTRGVTDTSITLESISNIAPPSGQEPIPGIDAGIKARVARANTDKELKRTLDYKGVKDDTGDEGRDLDVAREAVLSDKAFGLFITSQGASGSGDFLNQEKVPYIGWGFSNSYCGDFSYGFGFSGCLATVKQVSTGVTGILFKELEKQGKKISDIKVAMINEDFGSGRAGLSQVYSATVGQGAQVVYAESALPPETQGKVSDYTPYVQAILGKNPDVIFVSSGFSNTVGLTGALKAAGYQGTIINAIAYVPGLLDASPDIAAALDGSYIVIVGFGASEFGGPQWDQVKADCKASAGDKCSVSLGFIVGYSSADFFIQTAKELERREASDGWEFNAENFVSVLNSGYELPGFGNVYGPTKWPDDRNQNSLCDALVKVNGTKFEPIADLDCSFQYVPFNVLK